MPKSSTGVSKWEAFTYSKVEATALIAPLEKVGLQAGWARQRVLAVVTSCAHRALICKDRGASYPKLYAGTARGQLRRLAKSVTALLGAFDSLAPEVQLLIDKHLDNYYDPQKRPLAAHLRTARISLLLRMLLTPIRDATEVQARYLKPVDKSVLRRRELIERLPSRVREVIERADCADRRVTPFPRKGAPRNEAVRLFALELCNVYHEATGKLPARRYSQHTG